MAIRPWRWAPNDTDQMDMRTLWNTDNDRARAELHWRITLVFTVFMMALMVVPLSVVNPRQGRVLSMLPAMLLYLLFFLIQTSIKSNGGKGKLGPGYLDVGGQPDLSGVGDWFKPVGYGAGSPPACPFSA